MSVSNQNNNASILDSHINFATNKKKTIRIKKIIAGFI